MWNWEAQSYHVKTRWHLVGFHVHSLWAESIFLYEYTCMFSNECSLLVFRGDHKSVWLTGKISSCHVHKVICNGFLFCFNHPCSAHVGHIGTDRSLLKGHNDLLLRQIARDLSHTHDNTWYGLC